MSASRYLLTLIAFALLCVHFGVSAGAAFLPPDPVTQGWVVIASLFVAIVLTLAYYRTGRPYQQLWAYLLAVLVCTALLALVVLPAAVFLGVARYLGGVLGFLFVAGTYVVAYLVVFRYGWRRIWDGVLRLFGRAPREA